jgi:hypothetical protein
MPADGWAICVQLPVFKLATLKLGALYTNPRYSARNEKCLVNAYSAPAPYTNAVLVSKVAPVKLPPKLPVGSNTRAPAPARAYGCSLAKVGSLTTASHSELVDVGLDARGCATEIELCVSVVSRSSPQPLAID